MRLLSLGVLFILLLVLVSFIEARPKNKPHDDDENSIDRSGRDEDDGDITERKRYSRRKEVDDNESDYDDDESDDDDDDDDDDESDDGDDDDDDDTDSDNDDDGDDDDRDEDREKNRKGSKGKGGKRKDDSDENDKERLTACDKKDSICKCDGETLDCSKKYLNGEVVYSANIDVRKPDFIAKTVHISGTHIKYLYKGKIIPDMEADVEKLDLSGNEIRVIKKGAFNKFKNLAVLDLSENKIKNIGRDIFTDDLSDIRRLFLHNNKIDKITKSTFINLRELKILELDYNPNLKLYKDSFPKELENLEQLSLNYCDIKKLDDEIFKNLPKLNALSLVGNPLTRIPKAINAIPQLSLLDLSATHIDEIRTKEMESDHELSELRLENLKYLYTIDDCAFCGFPKLQKLSLENATHLKDIAANAFGTFGDKSDSDEDDSDSDSDSDSDDDSEESVTVPVLKELNLKNCGFTKLPPELLSWEKVEKLSISQNPFDCNCDMTWLMNENTFKSFTEPPICATPKNAVNKTFAEYNRDVCGRTPPSKDKGSRNIVVSFVLLMGVIGAIAGFLFYTRRIRVTNFMYRPEVPQMGYSNLTAQQPNPDDRDLQDDFHPRPDAVL